MEDGETDMETEETIEETEFEDDCEQFACWPEFERCSDYCFRFFCSNDECF